MKLLACPIALLALASQRGAFGARIRNGSAKLAAPLANGTLVAHSEGQGQDVNADEADASVGNGSAFGQDEWVLSQNDQLTDQPASPYFLDLGAFDGRDCSNTYQLEKHGWHGVCVEPMPHDFSMRQCQLVEKVLFDGSEVQFRACPGQLAGVSNESIGNNKWAAHQARCPLQKFQSITATELLSSISAPPVIDYVSLDIEGAELTLLTDWPVAQHCVRLWTIEHNNESPRKEQIREWLTGQGCTVTDKLGKKGTPVDFWASCTC